MGEDDPIIVVNSVSITTGVMIKGLTFKDANRSFCGRCRGKGFDRFSKDRAARQCPRCKGEGSTKVGGTKR